MKVAEEEIPSYVSLNPAAVLFVIRTLYAAKSAVISNQPLPPTRLELFHWTSTE